MSNLCLIVGAGPAGLMLANLLSKYGVPYRIIEQSAEPVIQTKAAALWAKSMEAMHHLDLSQIFLDISHRSYAAHMYSGGQKRVNLDMSKIPSFYNFITLLPQHLTEHALSQSLERQGVSVERGLKLQLLEGNTATLESVSDGSTQSAEYRYVFGCDGSHSRVRKEIGATFEGEQLPGFWMVGDMKIEAEELAKDEVSMFLGPAGPFAVFALGGDRYRVVASVPERVEPLTSEHFESAAKARLPFAVAISDAQHLTNFAIHERQADKYTNGVGYLVGDAAHIHSPAGGQGMNTGLQDAFNLAWKVAQVILWDSPSALLESYQTERHPVARRVLEASSVAIKMVGLTNPVARKVQAAAMSLVGNIELAQAKIREGLAETDIRYGVSPLNIGKGTKNLKPGDRMPEVFWRDATSQSHRLYDLLTGFHWTLLSFETGADLAGMDASRMRQVVISRLGKSDPNRLSDPCALVAEACGASSGHLLIRPDGYVAGHFEAGQEEALKAYWAQHCGQVAVPLAH